MDIPWRQRPRGLLSTPCQPSPSSYSKPQIQTSDPPFPPALPLQLSPYPKSMCHTSLCILSSLCQPPSQPVLSLNSLHSQARSVSTLTRAMYTQEHLTFPCLGPLPPSTALQSAFYNRRMDGAVPPCSPTPSSTPRTGPLWKVRGLLMAWHQAQLSASVSPTW